MTFGEPTEIGKPTPIVRDRSVSSFTPTKNLVNELRRQAYPVAGMEGNVPYRWNNLLSAVEVHQPEILARIDRLSKEPMDKPLPQEDFNRIYQWLTDRRDSSSAVIDKYVNSLPASALYAMLGVARLKTANNPSDSVYVMEKTKLVEDKIQQRKKIDQKVFETQWRASSLSPLDKLFVLLGNSNLGGTPEILPLIQQVLSRDTVSVNNSFIFGKNSFFLRTSQGHLAVVSSHLGEEKFGDDTTYSNLESRVLNILSYGRNKGLFKLNDPNGTVLAHIADIFRRRILYSEPSSPYPQSPRDQIIDPMEGIPQALKPFYFTDSGNTSSTDFRLRVEFPKLPSHQQEPAHFKTRNEDVAGKAAKALATLIINGYPVGFKLSSGEFYSSAVVVYVAPIALEKTLKVFAKEGLFDPAKIQTKQWRKDSKLFFQPYPSQFNVRRSSEADFSPDQSAFMDRYLQGKLDGLRKTA